MARAWEEYVLLTKMSPIRIDSFYKGLSHRGHFITDKPPALIFSVIQRVYDTEAESAEIYF